MDAPLIEYLFNPELISDRLAGLPRTRAILRNPHDDGVPAISFPKLRKTRREILRVLGRSRSTLPHSRYCRE